MNSKNGDQKALAMIIKDHQAPGLVAFLKRLPHGTEAAFVRGVLYQWLLENQDTPDFEERLTDVVNGPGGRILAMPYGAVGLADPVGREPVGHERVGRKPGPKPGSRMPPQASPKKPPETQGVMPSGDAPRQTVSGQERHPVAAVATPEPQPAATRGLSAYPHPIAQPSPGAPTQASDQTDREADGEDLDIIAGLGSLMYPSPAQSGMPEGDAPRQTACGQELPLVAAVETLAPQPVPAPELLASPSQVADPIQVGQDDPQGKHRKKPPMKNWTASLFR